MKTTTHLTFVLSLVAALHACDKPRPAAPNGQLANSQTNFGQATSDIKESRAECTEKKMILATRSGADFTWGANKAANPQSATEVPIVGTMKLFGLITPRFVVKNGLQVPSLAAAEAQIDFLPETTESFNLVRDARIIQYIFGYDLAENPEGSVDNNATTGLLSFVMDAVIGDDLNIPTVTGNAISVKVIGTLWIAGFEVPLQVPVALTKTDTGYNLVNNAPFTVNVRGGTPSVNTLGLDRRVAEMLALVAPVTMQDQIDLSFDIDLDDICQ